MTPLAPLVLLGLAGAAVAAASAAGRKKATPEYQLPPHDPNIATPPSLPPANDPITSKTPGVWAQPATLTAEQRKKMDAVMKALSTPPVSATAIQAATALAGIFPFPYADQIRAKVATVSKSVPVPVPPAFTSLPEAIATAIARTMELENDPVRVRALIGQLKASPYAKEPLVVSAIQMLETKATQLETLHDQAKTSAEIDKVQNTPPGGALPTVPNPVLAIPATLQAQMNQAMAALATNPVTQQAVDFARQVATALTAAGFAVPAYNLKVAAADAEKKVGSATGGTYEVVLHDNPSKIAQKLTGDGNRWRELIKANPQKTLLNGNFKFLNPGEILKLPAGWGTSSAATSIVPQQSFVPVQQSFVPQQPVVMEPVTAPSRTYEVQLNDYASKIAQKLTGDGNRWRELIKANSHKTLLNGNFKFLKPGEILNLPAGW